VLKYASPAKVNLVLEVLGKREDGFHELRSLVQTVDLCDTLYFEMSDKVSFECTEPALHTPDNLVLKAVKLVKEATDCNKGVKVRLEKHIPWGAGLGGGSSNAATTLLALNKLWGLGLSIPELTSLAAKLGSDVPFFIYGGLALVDGRGEKVTPLGSIQPGWLILLVPDFAREAEKTKRLFSLLRREHFTHGEFITAALESWQKQRQIEPSLLFNAFDAIAFDAFPGLEKYRTRLQELGLRNIHLVGSGPTLFAPVESNNTAQNIVNSLTADGFEAYAVPTLGKPQLQSP
jgi:4-diphosphocytidyl-2-C-methyl-D-erythritol kinase